MSSPVDEHKLHQTFPFPNATTNYSDDDGTIVGDGSARQPSQTSQGHESGRDPLHLNVDAARRVSDESYLRSQKSPSQSREEASRLDDDLRLLQIERQVSVAIDEKSRERSENGDRLDKNDHEDGTPLEKAHTVRPQRSHREDVIDDFDVATNPLHERAQIYKPPAHPTTSIAKFFKKVHSSSFLIRYVTYITPVTLILLIPLLIGALVPAVNGQNGARVGGVELLWFMVWLEIVWLSLWAGRILAKALPYPVGLVMSLFTNNSKKWRDMVKQLEVAATLFFWMLAVEISFLPTMVHHQIADHPGGDPTSVKTWEKDTNKVLISFLVLASLNLIEKIIIQLIAISFHQRTYEDRIELNKFQIGSLTKLYTFSKLKLKEVQDSDFEAPSGGPGSGARTPGAVLEKAQKNTQKALNQFGDVAGKIAGDFTGRDVKQSNHPSQVVLALLASTPGSQVLARRLYRTFNREETETVHQEDLTEAFENEDECNAAFAMFDKDMNGDISMEELEAVCVEIGRERKAITASLKDLDSVVSKLDNCLMVIVVVVSILVLVSLISTAAAAGITNAGSVVLALSWLLSATAQEFLQSLIFVFVKHPFDVGDRVTIYGNTGATLKGDDYFVKEIALLYTEFKKMEGHIVQAPNSYLNTLFILNQRRSGGLAEAVSVTFKFGTTIDQIDQLRLRLLDFVKAEKREFQGNILTELRDIVEAHSININVIFFFKSNWQNELLRLQRRNKFICAMMITIQELGIEGPRMRYPGQKDSFPVYLQHMPFNESQRGRGGNPDNPMGLGQNPNTETTANELDPNFTERDSDRTQSQSRPPPSTRPRGPSVVSIGPARRGRSDSVAAQAKRYDFSLGVESLSSGDMTGDVFEDRSDSTSRARIPINLQTRSRSRAETTSRARPSNEFGMSTARSNTFGPGFLHRTTTEGTTNGSITGSIHRNRFFSRHSRESQRPDVERMENGMAGIPEEQSRAASAANTRTNTMFGAFPGSRDIPPPLDSQMEMAEGVGAAAAAASRRIDPRSGLVSPAAVRLRTDESNGSVLPEMDDAGRSLFQAQAARSETRGSAANAPPQLPPPV